MGKKRVATNSRNDADKSGECRTCLMDDTASIFRNSPTGCNFCDNFGQTGLGQSRRLESSEDLARAIKRSSSSNEYDCIVGVSGGLDSSWVLHRAVSLGLRPLAVHMDNGWNSELASNNIRQLVSSLGVDLVTHVIDWSEYRNMMQSFFDSDVVDVELLYDNAMLGVCFGYARKHGLKHILSGSNYATEGVQMPPEWAATDKRDQTNILAICNAKRKDFPSFPFYSNWQYVVDRLVHRIRWVPLLDREMYNKREVTESLVRLYGYKPYPYKHYENIFTRFYQAEILPVKFGFDKRKPHLSALVLSGQITRAEGLAMLSTAPYPTEEEALSDRLYFLKKMGWTEEELRSYLARPARSHAEWRTDKLFRMAYPAYQKLKGLWTVRVSNPAGRKQNG